MEWYYADASDQQHAVSEAALRSLIASGAVRRDSLVWNETMVEWRPAGEMMPELFTGSPPVLTPAQVRHVHGGQGAYTHSPPQQATDATAVVSLVLGILAILGCGALLGIPAVICGHIARKRAAASSDSSTNAGLALAGLITGYLSIVLTVVVVAFYLAVIVFAVASEGGTGS